MNEAGAYAGNLVRSNGGADSAAAKCYRALNAPCGDSAGQRNDEIRIIIIGGELKSTVVLDFVPGGAQ